MFNSIFGSIGKVGSFDMINKIILFIMIIVFVGILGGILFIAMTLDSDFHKYVMFISVVILSIVLLYLGQKIQDKDDLINNIISPPCPDYWEATNTYSGKQYGATCVNTSGINMGVSELTSADFTSNSFLGDSGICKKYNWAKKNGIHWDTITNRDNLC